MYVRVGAGGQSARNTIHVPTAGDSSEAEGQASRRQDEGNIFKHIEAQHINNRQVNPDGLYGEELCAMFGGL